MANKFETTELDKLEAMSTDEKFKLGFRASRTIATEEQAAVIEKMTGAKSEPYPQPLWETHWPSFATALCEKLTRGHMEYGDRSFDLPILNLTRELEEEVLDIAGWGLLIWVRAQQLIKNAQELSHPEYLLERATTAEAAIRDRDETIKLLMGRLKKLETL